MTLANKVIIVTGASSGIGRATAARLAREGAHVVVMARRAHRLRELVDETSGYSGQRLAIAGDIRDAGFATELVASTVRAFGRLDVLINNAGVGHRKPVTAMKPEEFDKVVETNFLGMLYATSAAVRQMQRQEQGHIIDVSSIVGHRPLPRDTVYTATKSAINTFGRALRIECGAYNIAVTTVHVGITQTEFSQARIGEKGGNRFGLQGVPAERVAAAIAKAIHRRPRDVYITPLDWAFVHINRLFPRLSDWIVMQGTRLIDF